MQPLQSWPNQPYSALQSDCETFWMQEFTTVPLWAAPWAPAPPSAAPSFFSLWTEDQQTPGSCGSSGTLQGTRQRTVFFCTEVMPGASTYGQIRSHAASVSVDVSKVNLWRRRKQGTTWMACFSAGTVRSGSQSTVEMHKLSFFLLGVLVGTRATPKDTLKSWKKWFSYYCYYYYYYNRTLEIMRHLIWSSVGSKSDVSSVKPWAT